MSGLDDLKRYVDAAIDFSQNKVEGIIARCNLLSGSQIRFSQNEIDIGKRWDEVNLELFLIIDGAQTGYSERSVTSEEEVKQAVTDTIEFSKKLPESMFFAGVEGDTHIYRDLKGAYDSKIDQNDPI
jgi:predicted Zn-dependent protease